MTDRSPLPPEVSPEDSGRPPVAYNPGSEALRLLILVALIVLVALVVLIARRICEDRLAVTIHSDDPNHRVTVTRHLPDLAAPSARRDCHTKINDEHLGAAEVDIDGPVQSLGFKDDLRARWRGGRACVEDEVAHISGRPLNAGHLESSQSRRPGVRRGGASLADKDIAFESEGLRAREIKHIGRTVKGNFSEGRLDLQRLPKRGRKGELWALRAR